MSSREKRETAKVSSAPIIWWWELTSMRSTKLVFGTKASGRCLCLSTIYTTQCRQSRRYVTGDPPCKKFICGNSPWRGCSSSISVEEEYFRHTSRLNKPVALLPEVIPSKVHSFLPDLAPKIHNERNFHYDRSFGLLVAALRRL